MKAFILLIMIVFLSYVGYLSFYEQPENPNPTKTSASLEKKEKSNSPITLSKPKTMPRATIFQDKKAPVISEKPKEESFEENSEKFRNLLSQAIQNQVGSNAVKKDQSEIAANLEMALLVATLMKDKNFDKEELNEILRTSGTLKQYYESGELKSQWSVKDHKFDGESISYYESGIIRNKRIYQEGKKIGLESWYSESGDLVRQMEWFADGSSQVLVGKATDPTKPETK